MRRRRWRQPLCSRDSRDSRRTESICDAGKSERTRVVAPAWAETEKWRKLVRAVLGGTRRLGIQRRLSRTRRIKIARLMGSRLAGRVSRENGSRSLARARAAARDRETDGRLDRHFGDARVTHTHTHARTRARAGSPSVLSRDRAGLPPRLSAPDRALPSVLSQADPIVPLLF